jgi:hypothetical protein
MYGSETWTIRNEDQKCLENVEMCYWRMIEKKIWTQRMKDEVLLGVKKERTTYIH